MSNAVRSPQALITHVRLVDAEVNDALPEHNESISCFTDLYSAVYYHSYARRLIARTSDTSIKAA